MAECDGSRCCNHALRAPTPRIIAMLSSSFPSLLVMCRLLRLVSATVDIMMLLLWLHGDTRASLSTSSWVAQWRLRPQPSGQPSWQSSPAEPLHPPLFGRSGRPWSQPPWWPSPDALERAVIIIRASMVLSVAELIDNTQQKHIGEQMGKVYLTILVSLVTTRHLVL